MSSHSVNIIWLLILSQVQNGESLLVPVKQKATFPSELEDGAQIKHQLFGD